MDGRASVTKDEERVLRGGSTVMRLCRYKGWVVVRTLYVSERSLSIILCIKSENVTVIFMTILCEVKVKC